ncbi:MAG: serine hydrolase [Nocardiaceae bacterium]|nr:serine hydrolase [Nocardiaceae bacterium]
MFETVLSRISVAAIAVALVAQTACGSSPSEKATDGFDQGRFDTAIRRLNGLARDVMNRDHIPGLAVAVVHGDDMVFAQGYGVREQGKSAEVNADTVFQIASMSKSIGATVVATQVTAGKLTWDDPVTRFLPNLVLSDPYVTTHATVGDFYAHRTGLPAAAGDDLEELGFDRSYILDHLQFLPLGPFRDVYGYANFGTTAGAESAAVAAGTDWETLSENAVYKPLGMTSTSSRTADFLAHRNRTVLHARTPGGFAPLYQRTPDAQSPAGGVSSNVKDLARWMSMVLGDGKFGKKTIASPEALLPAVSAQITNRPAGAPGELPGFYGYGFNVDPQPTGTMEISHSGAFFVGGATRVAMLPELGVGIVVLTNAAPVGAAEALASQFLDVVQTGDISRDWIDYFGKVFAPLYDPAGDLVGKTRPTIAAPPEPFTSYVGTYSNPYFGDLVVDVQNGRLHAAMGPTGNVEFNLDPWDGNTFAFTPPLSSEAEGSLSSVTFDVDDGTVKQDYFNRNGLGTWTKSM